MKIAKEMPAESAMKTMGTRTPIVIRASLDSFSVDPIGDDGGGRVCSLAAVVVVEEPKGPSTTLPVDVVADVPVLVPVVISVLFMSKLMRKAPTCGSAGVTWIVVVASIVARGQPALIPVMTWPRVTDDRQKL